MGEWADGDAEAAVAAGAGSSSWELYGADRPATLARELTKLHEEVVSATVGELAAQIGEGAIPAKGEFVLVLQGSPEPPEPTDEAILAALTAERADGATRSEAAQRVADAYGIPKRRVYALAVEPPKPPSPSQTRHL